METNREMIQSVYSFNTSTPKQNPDRNRTAYQSQNGIIIIGNGLRCCRIPRCDLQTAAVPSPSAAANRAARTEGLRKGTPWAKNRSLDFDGLRADWREQLSHWRVSYLKMKYTLRRKLGKEEGKNGNRVDFLWGDEGIFENYEEEEILTWKGW